MSKNAHRSSREMSKESQSYTVAAEVRGNICGLSLWKCIDGLVDTQTELLRTEIKGIEYV